MARLGLFPNSNSNYAAAACFEPTSVDLHQTGTFEGRSLMTELPRHGISVKFGFLVNPV